MLRRELVVFLVAVLIGSLLGVAASIVLRHWFSAAVADNAGLAVAATLAPATHARLVHGQRLVTLAPRIAVAAPLAYLVMRAVHAVVAS
jgi:hypothetical protein